MGDAQRGGSGAPLQADLIPGPHVRGLLFDCDGTLVNTLGAFQRGWTTLLAAYDFEVTDEWFTAHMALSGEPFVRSALPDLPIEEVNLLLRNVYKSFLVEIHLLEIYDHVVDVAYAYHGVLPLAVVSGGSRVAVESTLDAVGIRSLFDHVITLDDVGHGKPAPDLYLRGLERLGLDAADCMAYEDSAVGMAAARAAGIYVVDVRTNVTAADSA